MLRRETDYAKELARGTLVWSEAEQNEARVELLDNKLREQEEIRFSWWKGDKMMMRPLDLTESELLKLLRNAIKNDVFSPGFLKKLRNILPG